jgi:hypothetical protein
MNKEKQRIAIAEACGIVSRDQWGPLYKTALGVVRVCPDYLNDLNAMHEAERVLSRGEHYNQTGEFGLYLQNLDLVRCGRLHLIEATAAERAEAFLKTIGKWEDDK